MRFVRRLLPVVVVLLAGCQSAAGTPATSTGQSPSPIASTSPSATPASPLMVVMSPVAQAQHTLTVVGLDGRSVAHATAAYGDQKAVPFPGSAAAGSPSSMAGRGPQFIAYHDGLPSLPTAGVCCDAFLPTLSISDTRVYFPDWPTAVRYLGRDGSTGLATSLPNPTPTTPAGFSISPDDRRIPIAVFDWSCVGPMISIVIAPHLNLRCHSIDFPP